jgi:hypothetical protein
MAKTSAQQFAHPRDRDQIRKDPLYPEIHARALDFLYHRFDHDES